ncbi:hypothetical protein J6590_039835 [Homalodisca vitripennis]|nr:hypothetical protein J6590_039835 [Homalodisca vitripennis]
MKMGFIQINNMDNIYAAHICKNVFTQSCSGFKAVTQFLTHHNLIWMHLDREFCECCDPISVVELTRVFALSAMVTAELILIRKRQFQVLLQFEDGQEIFFLTQNLFLTNFESTYSTCKLVFIRNRIIQHKHKVDAK